jgi:hypothetical protein
LLSLSGKKGRNAILSGAGGGSRGDYLVKECKEWKLPLCQGRLLLVPPWEENRPDPIAALARARNEFMAALAADSFVARAFPGSKTDRFCLAPGARPLRRPTQPD